MSRTLPHQPHVQSASLSSVYSWSPRDSVPSGNTCKSDRAARMNVSPFLPRHWGQQIIDPPFCPNGGLRESVKFVVKVVASGRQFIFEVDSVGPGEVHQICQDVPQAGGGVLARDTAFVALDDFSSTVDAVVVLFALQFREPRHGVLSVANRLLRCIQLGMLF